MKRVLKRIGLVLLLLIVLAAACALLYRHFVLNQIMDRGGMENPFSEYEAAEEPAAAPEADESVSGSAVLSPPAP